MKTRGLEVPEGRSNDPPLEEHILRASTWQRVGEKRRDKWEDHCPGGTPRRREPSKGKATRVYKMKKRKKKTKNDEDMVN